jgi:hypothetical protein
MSKSVPMSNEIASEEWTDNWSWDSWEIEERMASTWKWTTSETLFADSGQSCKARAPSVAAQRLVIHILD